MKKYLMNASILSCSNPREDLYMYLVVSEHAVSAILLKVHEGIQIGKTLVDAETKYLHLEKLTLALVQPTRKLPHYFQAYTIYMLTEYPL